MNVAQSRATLRPEVSVRHQPGIAPARSRHTELVGRAAECSHLVQFLADLRAGSGAEAHFSRSLAQLSHTRSRTELARSQLMLGEWLQYHLRKVFLKLGITSRAQLPESVGYDPRSKTLT